MSIPSVWVNSKNDADRIDFKGQQPKINQWFSIGDRGYGLVELVQDLSVGVSKMKARFGLIVVDQDMNITSYDDLGWYANKKDRERANAPTGRPANNVASSAGLSYDGYMGRR